ncbi:MAG: prepilin-type N-terminal cleavage/methylation domain-containing protein [bacterium]|nr:prepilin-type N-terminal cleavage/methylation domain-containing protein [bacterium]
MASRKKAFTLIELLAVIAIIGILAGFIFAAVSGAIERAKITKTRAAINSLELALKNYERDAGSFTGLLTELDASNGQLDTQTKRARLVEILTGKKLKPDGTFEVDKDTRDEANWNGPYLEPRHKELSEKGELVDAWGHPLFIRIKALTNFDPHLHNPDSFDIWSTGPNEESEEGKSHGMYKGRKADDINNWD